MTPGYDFVKQEHTNSQYGTEDRIGGQDINSGTYASSSNSNTNIIHPATSHGETIDNTYGTSGAANTDGRYPGVDGQIDAWTNPGHYDETVSPSVPAGSTHGSSNPDYTYSEPIIPQKAVQTSTDAVNKGSKAMYANEETSANRPHIPPDAVRTGE